MRAAPTAGLLVELYGWSQRIRAADTDSKARDQEDDESAEHGREAAVSERARGGAEVLLEEVRRERAA